MMNINKKDKDQDYENLIQKVFEFKCQKYLHEKRKKLQDDPAIKLREKMRRKEAEYEAKLLGKDAEWKQNHKELNNFLIENFQNQNKILNNVRKRLIKTIPAVERDLKNLLREEQKLVLLMENKMQKFNMEQQFLVEKLQKKLNNEEMTWLKEFIRDWDEQTENIVQMMRNGFEINPIDLNVSFGLCPEIAVIEPTFNKNVEKTDDISISNEELTPSTGEPVTTTIEIVKPKKSVRFSKILKPVNRQEKAEPEKKFFDEKSFEMSKINESNSKMEFNFDEDSDLTKKDTFEDSKDNFKTDFAFNFEQSIETVAENAVENFMFNFSSME
ncbi:hypothetical protein DERP_009598 [Dermatophagoides pteronyssinus]|uniref:Uncharacterized protein n=2 Tax=Dermatophagoides pteronyssinus TaxID=6956 RepID=A0ABQ8JAC5_DERPT|nr:uncharacterized protein LOC113793273 [Dermatophagoides pteronyssinus]KAH9419541.1 hypothetical protein DERP_009598 [Dermatophagoides pteronyssinus]